MFFFFFVLRRKEVFCRRAFYLDAGHRLALFSIGKINKILFVLYLILIITKQVYEYDLKKVYVVFLFVF